MSRARNHARLDAGDRARARRFRAGWLHLCNGLDPVRDGGMVPSILGMTGALAGTGGAGDDRHAHALAARTRRRCPDASTLEGPETDLEAVGPRRRGRPHARPLAGPHPARGAGGTAGGRPLPDRRARHGRALGPAAQGVEEDGLHGPGRGQEPPPGVLPARPVAARDRPPPRRSPPGRRSASSPTASTSSRSTTCPLGPSSKPSSPSWPASSSSSSSAGSTSRRGSTCWPRPWRRARAAIIPSCTCCWPATTTGRWRRSCDRIERRSGSPSRVTYVGHVRASGPGRSGARPTPSSCPATAKASAWRSSRPWPAASPCLITTACHFPELAEAEGGIVVEPDARRRDQGPPRPARTVARASGAELGANGPAAGRARLHLGPAGPTPGRRLPLAVRRRAASRLRDRL